METRVFAWCDQVAAGAIIGVDGNLLVQTKE